MPTATPKSLLQQEERRRRRSQRYLTAADLGRRRNRHRKRAHPLYCEEMAHRDEEEMEIAAVDDDDDGLKGSGKGTDWPSITTTNSNVIVVSMF